MTELYDDQLQTYGKVTSEKRAHELCGKWQAPRTACSVGKFWEGQDVVSANYARYVDEDMIGLAFLFGPCGSSRDPRAHQFEVPHSSHCALCSTLLSTSQLTLARFQAVTVARCFLDRTFHLCLYSILL